jgi:two-component system chemotaxis response regulator CheY
MARILIIDDAVFMRKMLADILADHGHVIVGEGSSAKEAIEKFSALKPDLMTLDIEMPEESGIDSLSAVQSIMQDNPTAKILMISSIGKQSVITQMLTAGACDFIVKPFQQDTILKSVCRILGGKRSG